jgi:hypothetical protein
MLATRSKNGRVWREPKVLSSEVARKSMPGVATACSQQQRHRVSKCSCSLQQAGTLASVGFVTQQQDATSGRKYMRSLLVEGTLGGDRACTCIYKQFATDHMTSGIKRAISVAQYRDFYSAVQVMLCCSVSSYGLQGRLYPSAQVEGLLEVQWLDRDEHESTGTSGSLRVPSVADSSA